jgi:phage/plasmid-associated DNA primase
VSLSQDKTQKLLQLKAVLEKKKHTGVLTSTVGEVLNMVRRNTFTSKEEINPPSHIPFKNGVLNLNTWKLEPLNPSLFYTWQINANYLNRNINPKTDLPLFVEFLSHLVEPKSILPLLFYFSYATLYPDFPAHKVLFLVGRQRTGKGSAVRLLQLLNPHGFGTIDVCRLLDNDIRFDLFSVIDKNFIVDPEMKRARRNADWSILNKIFGGDYVDIEGKYRQKYSGRLKCKGIFIGNLPILKVDSPATIERIICVQTKSQSILQEERIPNIERVIFEKEGDAIATYFVHLLKILIAKNFIFPEKIKIDEEGEIVEWKEIDLEERAEILDLLADSVQLFIEEMTQHAQNDVEPITTDEVFQIYLKWCSYKGIIPLTKQVFVQKLSREFPKKRIRIAGKLRYAFTDLTILNTISDNNKRLEQSSDIGNDTQYNNSSNKELLFQLLDLKLVGGRDNVTCNKVSFSKLEHPCELFKVAVDNAFPVKGVLFQPFHGFEKSPEPVIEDEKDLNYFKSDRFYTKEFFRDLGVELTDYCSGKTWHYYAINIPETLTGEKAYKFSSLFSINAQPISKDEFKRNKEGNGNE